MTADIDVRTLAGLIANAVTTFGGEGILCDYVSEATGRDSRVIVATTIKAARDRLTSGTPRPLAALVIAIGAELLRWCGVPVGPAWRVLLVAARSL